MIEAELKARVRNPDALRARLRALADEEISLYQDTYYDRPGRDLSVEGRELRVRIIVTGGQERAVLTYKEPSADAASDSKPEHETTVGNRSIIDIILRALGMEQLVTFQKHCANYRFTAWGRNMLATVVTVPEIDGTFVELETLTTELDLPAALEDVRAVLNELGITNTDLTAELYTEAVMRARA